MKKLIVLLLTLASILGTFIITTSAASNHFDWDDISSSNTISFYADAKVRTYTSKKLSTKSGSIYSGDLVKIIKVYDDSVARVEYPISNGTKKKAYIALDSLIESNSDKWDAFTATEKIKVYRADDLKKSFGSIYKGDECFVISSSSGVAQVLYPVSKGYKVGYISTKVLSTESIDSDSSGSMMYEVPHYQQSDKKWASITLNPKASTKRTIGSHGCTTTAAAMLCAWTLDDKSITPATIQKTASYTSDNLLEWDSLPIDDVTLKTYNKTMSSSIRKDLVKLLKDGPVIIGAAKNASGGREHWVIVVGFIGDPDAPRNSDFIVLDPAKKAESTLNDFLQNRTYIKRLVYAK